MPKCELLAPAGTRESLVAAVQAGANAVYLGFGDFNARRRAGNFSAEEFAEAVQYCHLRGVKVYLTLNTLLNDRELPAAAEEARYAARCGVDAILVQDLGVLELLKEVIPTVPLHASTQMSLMTSGGVREAQRSGISRAVLARELSRDDTQFILDRAEIEIESFVHGALCMCYSGQCALSALIGSRSGNRGLCAQPCRLSYRVGDGSKVGHPLSPKDSCLASFVPEMAEMGIASLKLEGRMKRAEYVATVTDIYARLLREHRAATPEELQTLREIFSRDGFTDGYWRGETGRAMFGTRDNEAPEPTALYERARAIYEKEDRRKIAVRFDCRITPEGSSLTAEDEDGNLVSITGETPQRALRRALTEEEVRERLAKTGGTAFTVADCRVSLGEGLMLSAAALNALRREALERLTALRTEVPAHILRAESPIEQIPNSPAPPRLTVSLLKSRQCSEALLALTPATVYLPIEELDAIPDAWLNETEFCAVLPRVFRDGECGDLRARLERAVARGVRAATVGNLGHFSLLDGLPLKLYGDYSLNIFNSRALLWCRHRGLARSTVSFELRREQLRDLNKPLPTEAIVYGRLPLMITENCPTKNNIGCRHGEGSILYDRTGAAFPLTCAYGCRAEVQNCKPQFLADRDDYKTLGLAYARLRFTVETAEECVQVFERYLGKNDFTPDNYTRGLYTRGVE